MERASRGLVKIAVERGYLEPRLAEEVLIQADVRRCPPERILLERRLLSPRRLERLRNHVEYRTMRNTDKGYAQLGVQLGLLLRRQAQAGLAYQRQVFERRRERVRLGSYLIARGWLTEEEDRELRARLSGQHAWERPARRRSAEATLPLALDSDSRIGSSRSGSQTSYRAIEEALERVEAIKAIQEDLSTSDARVSPDSAAEFENACRVLARRRQPDLSASPRRSRPRTAAALRTLFGSKGAA